ncbi:MAG TPA: agmatinase family protein [Phycisphaerales bacterium]|nr:agmatinase family protein [Phycisphaerales bacterium]
MPFDPDAAAAPGTGIFGLPHTLQESRIMLLPVPFDATTSYRRGTADGPEAIRTATMQVDLYDRRFGRVYEQGIFMHESPAEIRHLSDRAGELAAPLIEGGGTTGDAKEDQRILHQVNAACEQVNAFTYHQTKLVLNAGKIPGLLGGEHSVPFGAIRAVAEHYGAIGILHLDAHMDFREAFEGFAWSHASIMHNVLSRIPQVTKLVQVGIRDVGERELEFARAQGGRVEVRYDDVWAEQLGNGTRFNDLAASVIAALPDKVYVSFDIDALDPSLCPNTGTPVPGGLSFNQASLILQMLRESGKTVVGFDLVEVAPGAEEAPEWDANVGARVLYKLCGAAMPR